MCGIWGYINILKKCISNTNTHVDTNTNISEQSLANQLTQNPGLLYNAFSQIKHRGPDRSIFREVDDLFYFFLGFHRLSIMDTSTSGDQPFIIDTPERTIYCLVNGEIYNYETIQKEYAHILDNKLKSKSDCEVIPHLYKEFGVKKLFSILHGEFAIAIVDIDRENNTMKLYLGRDRFGVRPLFFSDTPESICFSSEMKALIEVVSDTKTIKYIRPGTILLKELVYSQDRSVVHSVGYEHQYYDTYYPMQLSSEPSLECSSAPSSTPSSTPSSEFSSEHKINQVLETIRSTFEHSVIEMMNSDRDMGALLSGGLDSSLVVSIASKYLHSVGKRLKTFSIGLPGSTDREYAELVANFCDTDHTHIEFTNEQFLSALVEIIRVTETFDTTTIRASTGQYLVSRWISQNTNIKVLLIGDGSDELTGGYMYFHLAPTLEDFHNENKKLLSEISVFDVLRADRGIASNGLEARVPFLDHKFVDLYMSIDPILRVPIAQHPNTKPIEKWLLRKSFDTNTYLPDQVLWRKKEAFSDGVSSVQKSWYSIVQDYTETIYSDQDLLDAGQKFIHCPPRTKEALYYREIFEQYYPNCSHVIPHYWLPNWCGAINEPSARVLDVYK